MRRVEDAIELERRIAARPEVVFSYFTDPERYRLWHGVDAELDPTPGGVFRVTSSGRSRTVVEGEFVVVEPPRRVVFTWGWRQVHGLPDGMRLEPGTSRVEVVLEADGDSTILRLRHSGLPTAAACQFHTWGWGLTLDRLVPAAEGRDPGPNPFAEL